MADSSAATLRRHNSMVAPPPSKLSVPHRTSSLDSPHTNQTFELVSFNANSTSSSFYTSLRDVLPSFSSSAVNSPTAASSSSISIRNRLVKHAAWAYLQPMSSSPSSSYSASSTHFLRRFSACLGSLFRRIAKIFDRILLAFRSLLSKT
ncbi:hypothetical protein HN51_016166 [Arachis hypogaea]|uniref:Uncharacterized protein n=1 Tax=Arachis hypogaea TaxID=3818 RepID=A0A445CRL8_ARAHY|nr:uncharacterized protein LOC112696757 [Arachis hypogaea]RYR53523.1 hypothetical protein Ahy_A06g028680 [Arachis hypogaea]